MLRKIESLRHEPKPIRDRYAFYWASIVTLVIAGFWAISLPSKFAAITNIGEVVNEDDESGGFSRAIDDIKNNFSASLLDLKELTSTTTDPTAEEIKESDHVPAADNNVIDIAGMFATTSESEPAPTAPAPKVIRIATTSQISATGTVLETD